MTDIAKTYQRQHPDVAIRFVSLDFSEASEALTAGRVDVAFIRPRLNDDRFDEFTLIGEQRYVILPQQDERARLPGLSHTALDRDTFLTPGRGTPNPYRSFLHLLADRNQEIPRIVDTRCERAEEFLTAIASGQGIATTVKSFTTHYQWPGIAYVPLTDATDAETTAIVDTADQRTIVRDFTQLLAA